MTPRMLLAKLPAIIQPNTIICGFALFTAANSAIAMGGAFPFLPLEFQTYEKMFIYYLFYSVSFALFLFAACGITYRAPRFVAALLPCSSITYFVGCLCTIAVLYDPRHSTELLIASGTCLGLGSSGMNLLWQRIFAALENDEGSRSLIVGMALAAIIYFALYLIPIAVTQIIIAVALLPLFVLCLSLGSREIDKTLPMFSDTPLMHPEAYAKTAKDYWRIAVCIGAVGLASGIIRSLAITDPTIGAEVNAAALAGSFVAAAILLLLWRSRALKFSVYSAFRIAFPFMVVGFMLLPILGDRFVHLFSTVLYMAYSFANMLVLMQCAQISRDRGLNPLIVFGGFAGIVYAMHDLGFVSGYLTDTMRSAGVEPFMAIALIAVTLLALSFFAGSGGLSGAINSARKDREQIELIAFAPANPSSEKSTLGSRNRDASQRGAYVLPDNRIPAPAAARPSSQEKPTAQPATTFASRCLAVQATYRLTDRETEIMELLAHGRSMRSIAEDLVVSENTIRTHAKRIYAKLDVHKRRDLQDLIESF